MFRCITEVKGLIFDFDSFRDVDYESIIGMFSDYEILFMMCKMKEMSIAYIT